MDPLNLILLVVVVLIGLKLRSVLGTRNDDEQPGSRADAYRLNRDAFERTEARENEQNEEAVLKAPAPQPEQELMRQSEPENAETTEAVGATTGEMTGATMGDDEIAGRGLAYLRSVEPDFDEAGFLDGAGRAYEMILTAFAGDDLSPVQAFLGDAVADGFQSAIAARQAEGQVLETRILRLDRPALDDARIENGMVQLDVRFRAEIVSFTRDASAQIDEDNLPPPATAHDVWVFERALAAADPNWQLVATHSA